MEEDDERLCYGGVARLLAVVEDIKRKEENVVWLNAGDLFHGSIWYTYFGWRVAVKINQLLNFDAMALGEHEFDDGVEGLVPFLVNRQASPYTKIKNLQGTVL